MRRIAMTTREVNAFLEMDFANTVTGIINRLIGTELIGWNMDFLVGKTPFHMVSMPYKIHIAELWHNTGHSFGFLERGLLVSTQDRTNDWNRVAVRIGILWGVYGEMLWAGAFTREAFPDLVITEQDFSMLLGAWYARKMGLPLGNIVCGCDEDSPLWELFAHGLLRTGKERELPKELPLLLEYAVGKEAGQRYRNVSEEGGVFTLTPEELSSLQKGIFISVVGRDRLSALVSTLAGKGYRATEEGAAAYGALQYYRASGSTSVPAIVLLERSPGFMI